MVYIYSFFAYEPQTTPYVLDLPPDARNTDYQHCARSRRHRYRIKNDTSTMLHRLEGRATK